MMSMVLSSWKSYGESSPGLVGECRVPACCQPSDEAKQLGLWVCWLVVWRNGNVIHRTNEVTLHRARSVLGWVTISNRVYHFGM